MNDAGARPLRPAGFWIRLVAFLVDAVVVGLAQAALVFVASRIWGREIDQSPGFPALVGFFTVLFACVYTTVAHSVTGQTVGKTLVNVRVVGVDGAPLAAGAALLRWLAYAVSALPLGMGFVMAGLRTDKRALHDLLAGSRVDRVRPAGRPAPPRPRAAGQDARETAPPARVAGEPIPPPRPEPPPPEP